MPVVTDTQSLDSITVLPGRPSREASGLAHSLESVHLISNLQGEATLQVRRQYKCVRKFISVPETREGIRTASLVEADQTKEKDTGLESARGRARQ